jgi:hypothetical protein
MLKPFFDLAMIAPARHVTFRRVVVAHVLAVAAAAWVVVANGGAGGPAVFGYGLLALAMVEGSALVGWRLTQLPKSQALEFLLASPIQPRRVFAAEAAVGFSRFALVWLAGLPVFLGLVVFGLIAVEDLWPLAVLPLVWGSAVAAALTAWVYEPVIVRRLGELVALLGILVYLVVGVLAGENLVAWLNHLPAGIAQPLLDAILFGHHMNPFGVVRYWFAPDATDWVAMERFTWVTLAGVGLFAAASVRAAFRMKGHFHDRHYKPLTSERAAQTESIGDRPLSWWAVRRVMEYSGRVNVYLAGGFAVLYAAYTVAGDRWPPWMGTLVFRLFDQWGGPATVATAMCVLAAVPAVFQFGLWDSTVENRCRRLELLLLTELDAKDYWHASLAAAWKRGRAYLGIAGLLWLALAVGGWCEWWQALAAAAGGVAMWAFGFAFGFRSFSTGNQTSGLASLFTLGLPLVLFGLLKGGFVTLAGLVPTGLCHLPVTQGMSWTWAVGLTGLLVATVWLTRTGLSRCDADLRAWYDANQGKKAAG